MIKIISGQNHLKGIHIIKQDDSINAVAILCTINGANYKNEWILANKVLKYYLEARTNINTNSKTFNETISSNTAISDSSVIRNKKGEIYEYR